MKFTVINPFKPNTYPMITILVVIIAGTALLVYEKAGWIKIPRLVPLTKPATAPATAAIPATVKPVIIPGTKDSVVFSSLSADEKRLRIKAMENYIELTIEDINFLEKISKEFENMYGGGKPPLNEYDWPPEMFKSWGATMDSARELKARCNYVAAKYNVATTKKRALPFPGADVKRQMEEDIKKGRYMPFSELKM